MRDRRSDPDRKTVMSWLEGLAQDDWREWHSDSEVQTTAQAALDLLKAQEPKLVKIDGDDVLCPSCGNELYTYPQQKFCDECGQEVKLEWAYSCRLSLSGVKR